MPARASRSSNRGSAAAVVADPPSPGTESAAAATAKSKRGTKRGVVVVDGLQGEEEESSSLRRRSKRSRSETVTATAIASVNGNGNGNGVGISASENEEEEEEEEEIEQRSKKTAKSAGRANRNQRASKQSTTKETETEVSASVKVNKKDKTRTRNRISAKNADQDLEEEAEEEHVHAEEEEEDEEEEEQEEEINIKKKVSRKRKTKEEKETVEVMPPLAARTQGLRMFVGAHVSAAKGVHNAVANSVHIGGNAFALFLKSQRKWDNPPLQDDHRDQFRKFCVEYKYDAAKYVLPHGSYLVNLAQEDKAKAKQAYDSFLDDLRRCEQLGITLYNFHPGNTNQTSLSSALSRLANALTNALSATSTVIPVLETMCGHGTTIGSNLTDFRDLIALIPPQYRDRIGVCIDTCHSFAAGYDLVSPEGFQAFMKEFEEVVGLKYLRALHLNDSKAPRGSKRDLHANIGTGFLGLRAFHNVMNEKRFEGLPMILETPIDRPDPSFQKSTANGGNGQKGKRPKGAKPPTIEDKSVWAREIKLLESLIGMDPESAEFRTLEAQLADEGKDERERIRAQYERKLEAEEKKRRKALEKEKEQGQVTLEAMMTGKKKTTAKATAKSTTNGKGP
ncbi:hypothetical protein VTN00DRAFT_4823 [Thermoascus crustaceus]|uniref:uncharacterized protein n=1 Tax=Thermoascus crustaceus TaxID=5088 RepID=UPI003742BCB8